MFRIEQISYLLGLAAIPILALLIYLAWKRNQSQLKKLGDLDLIQSLIPGYSTKRFVRNISLILLGLFFLILSGTNPQWGTKRESVKTKSSDIFIALDISTSMMAEDVAPSRMERAKRFTQKLIDNLKGNRIGLVFFAGGAYIQMPLTNDYAAAKMMVKSASPTQAGTQGTDIGEAINLAEKGYQLEKNNQRAMIIITDGETHDEKAIGLAEEARENGCFIYTVGAGTEGGTYIPIVVQGRKMYKKDEAGNPVKTALNVNMINELASKGGGKPFLINQGAEAINRIAEDIDKLEKREVQQKSFTDFNSYFQYFLAIGIILLSLGLFLPYKETSKS